MQCLFETREELPAHGELYDTISAGRDHNDQDFGNILRLTGPELPFSPIQVPEYITGREYHERRNRFEICYHNGDWQGLYEESNKCTSSGIPEIVAIGYLELALGWIFHSRQRKILN
jgi:hypothetical protein